MAQNGETEELDKAQPQDISAADEVDQVVDASAAPRPAAKLWR